MDRIPQNACMRVPWEAAWKRSVRRWRSPTRSAACWSSIPRRVHGRASASRSCCRTSRVRRTGTSSMPSDTARTVQAARCIAFLSNKAPIRASLLRLMRNDRSIDLMKRAKAVIPGGVNSPVRAFRAVGGQPLFIAKAQGANIWDIDGNRYLDYVGSWGPMILGHAHPAVVEAARNAIERGSSFGAPTEGEVKLAELICRRVPSVQKVRLVSSGTEACMSAIRVARAFTKRDAIVKFEGCYHGHADYLLVKAGSGVATFGLPDSPGVPSDFAKHTLTLPYND